MSSKTLNLTPEQYEIVHSWGKGMAIQAGAGSGKTTTLVVKCEELLKRTPEARFAAVSFTEKSASDLRAKLSKKIPLEGHWVTTIHGLCGAILREYPREAGYDGEESMLSESEAQLLWERAIEQVWADEAQPEISNALERLLMRESRDSLWGLLRRARDLYLLGILKSLREKTDEDSVALATIAEFVLDRYDRLKRRRGALDFNDLEQGADRALESSTVREAFQKRFAFVMVDEFQDTNPVQARIILRFVKPDFSNLCVVGDPKQSIYRFRDADLSVFEEFCLRLPIRAALTWNFRSRPEILEFTNHVCEKAFSAGTYQPLVPKREPADVAVVQLPVKNPVDLARWIQSETQRGVPLEHIALILRKIRGNEKWLKALTAAGIPVALGSGGLFWEDPRTRELVSFLKWWDNPLQNLAGAVFLRAPWVGIPDAELDAWVKEDPTWVKPFFSSDYPIARALAEYREKITRPGELLLALLQSEKEEAELGATLLGLWHRTEELSSRGLDFHAVVGELVLSMEEKRRERDVPPPRNQGQLSVLTVHGSKGLEFPHVILVDLGKKGRAPNSPTLFWDRNRGAYLVGKDQDGERIEDEELELWKSEERSKEVAESKRVFYVALTRAQERLILALPELEEKDLKIDEKKIYNEDFWRGWIEASGALRNVPELKIPEVQARDTERSVQIGQKVAKRKEVSELLRPRHSVTEWNLLSRCPRAYEWTYVRPKISKALNPNWNLAAPSQEGEISQRELGTEVHACLETGDYARLEELEKRAGSERFQASRVCSWAENSPWMESGNETWAELSFEIPVAGQVLVGSMDRVVRRGDSFAIVDFKVTRHEKTAEGLLEAYRTQMKLYRWALESLQKPDPVEVETLLVNFSDTNVSEVKLLEAPFQAEEVASLAESAARIVAGEVGVPKPGSLCEVCQFRSECQPS